MLKMQTVRVFVLSTIFAASLAQCTERREETPEFFTSFTGIPLCEGAVVRNARNGRAHTRSGFDAIYDVDLFLNHRCKQQLIEYLRRNSNHQSSCDPSVYCAFLMENGVQVITRSEGGALRIMYND